MGFVSCSSCSIKGFVPDGERGFYLLLGMDIVPGLNISGEYLDEGNVI